MKVIFIDIDGVLATRASYETIGSSRYAPFGEEPVSNLNALIKHTGAKLVISSSWRICHSLKELREIFKVEGVEGEVIDTTAITSESRDRGVQIREWLEASDVKDIQFVILDDDSYDIKPHFPRKFVHTTMKHGLTAHDARLAEKILMEAL